MKILLIRFSFILFCSSFLSAEEPLYVAVGSKNKAKIEALKEVLNNLPNFSHSMVISVDSPSKVSAQPFSFRETLEGAKNRAIGAFENTLNCSYGFGIESGLMEAPGTRTGFLEITLCVIFDGKDFYTGQSTGFELPECVLDLMREKQMDLTEACIELGIAKDLSFGKEEGLIGVITKGRVNRKEYSMESIYMAMSQLDNAEIYQSTISSHN